MKHFSLTFLLLVFFLFGCNQINNKSTVVTNETAVTVSGNGKELQEREKLQELVRRLYEWHETKGSKHDFYPVSDSQNRTHIGLDLNRHKQRLTELKQTDFFAEQFLDNYNKLALTIDEILKTEKIEWLVGDILPFGNNTNPWCNCQDNPDNYWKTINITKLTLADNTAIFIWTWGKEFEYKVNAVKENGSWKISYLQGFDFNEMIPAKAWE